LEAGEFCFQFPILWYQTSSTGNLFPVKGAILGKVIKTLLSSEKKRRILAFGITEKKK
jgi:hypothetical protein